MNTRPLLSLLIVFAIAWTAACGGDDPVAPGSQPTLEFTPVTLDLDTLRAGAYELRNTSTVDSGPIVLGFERLRNDSGGLLFWQTQVTPGMIANLPAGAVDTIEFVVEDRGGAIKGKRIDVWHTSHRAALRFGVRRKVQVKILADPPGH